MDLRRLWHGRSSVGAELELHDSTLESLIVSTALQNAGFAHVRWRVPAAYRGAQMMSDLCAQLPWLVNDGGANSGQRAVEEARPRDELPGVLVRPDPFRSRGDFIREIILSLVWFGDAFILRESISEGLPTTLRVLDPATVNVERVEGRISPRYSVGSTAIPLERMDHIALNRLPGQLRGQGPFDSADPIIRGQVAADQFARELYESSGIPTGMLTHPGKLTKQEATELLEGWQDGQGQGRKTAVMGGGISYDPIGLSPDEGQLLQSRTFGVTEVARLLGIPAHLLQTTTGVAGSSGSSLTYSNLQNILAELVRQTLFPVYLTRIEEVASTWVPRGQSVSFDMSAYLRADEKSRFDTHKVGLDAGFLTIDEVRDREGLDPLSETEQPEATDVAPTGDSLAI